MDDVERRLRAGLHQLADGIEPSDLLRARTARALRRERRRPVALAVAAAVVVVAGAVVAFSGARTTGGADRNVVAGPAPSATAPAEVAPESRHPEGWRPMADAPIAGRSGASGVWTGEEVLVWGGETADGLRADGAAYDPALDRWRPIPAAPIAPRLRHAGVWTGRELVVWGGAGADRALGDGAAWNPETGRWRRLPPAPIGARVRFGAAATDSGKLVVWGGATGHGDARPLADGAVYDPEADQWTALRRGPLGARVEPRVVPLGEQVHVLGGDAGDGVPAPSAEHAVIDLETGAWSDLQAPVPAEIGPIGMAAAATRDGDVFVWGGFANRPGAPTGQAAVYSPRTGRWELTPPAPEIRATSYVPAVLLDVGVAVFDGNQGTGAVWDGASWRAVPPFGLAPRAEAVLVAAGRALVVWGGGHSEGDPQGDGAVWRPEGGDGPEPSSHCDTAADAGTNGSATQLRERDVRALVEAFVRTRAEGGFVEDCVAEGVLDAYVEGSGGSGTPGRDFLCLASCDGWRLVGGEVLRVDAADAASYEVLVTLTFERGDEQVLGGEVLFVGPGRSPTRGSVPAVVRGVEHAAPPR